MNEASTGTSQGSRQQIEDFLRPLKDFRKQRNQFKDLPITQKVQHEKIRISGLSYQQKCFSSSKDKLPMQFSFHAMFWEGFTT